MKLVYGNALLLICIILEIIIVRYIKKEPIHWKEVITNLNSGQIILWLFRGIIIACYLFIYQELSFRLFDHLPNAAIFLIALVSWDFCYYWAHRFHHHFKLLWAVHTVHHDCEHYNLSLGVRHSWYSSLSSFPFFSVLGFAGVPPEIFMTVSAIHYFVQFYNHNELVKKSGWLEYVLITPSHHRVHHGKNELYINKNFGGTFVWWDKLFKTFQEEREDVPVEFGIDEPILSKNPIVMSNLPFIKKWINYKKIPSPGYQKITFPISFLITGCVLLFSLLFIYMFLESSTGWTQKLFLALIIFAGVISNAELSEGKFLGFPLWLFTAFILIPSFIFLLPINVLPLFGLLALIMIHALITVVYYVKSIVTKPQYAKDAMSSQVI